MKTILITRESGIPLLGSIAFGIIDRGSNLLQVRPVSYCNLNCKFCSTDAGINSRFHKINYVVDVDYMLDWLKKIIPFKGDNLEIFIDSVGEPTSYPELAKLISGIKNFQQVKRISMVTNGSLLNQKKLSELKNAGLHRINISIHSLDKTRASYLMGNKDYDVNKVISNALYAKEIGLEVLIVPVFLPGFNDKDIEELIKFSKENGLKIMIQKYEEYKYSRKMKEASRITWWKFYRKLESWEKEYGIKLKTGPKDFEIENRPSIPIIFDKYQKIPVELKIPGWIPDQAIGTYKNRAISINNCNTYKGKKNVKILENKNNIYIAE